MDARMDARVEIVREISPETGQELVDTFARLLPQLSATARPLARLAFRARESTVYRFPID
ncbi:hypothetical protein ACIOC1_09900 [Streptomyces sp. NPDC088197]